MGALLCWLGFCAASENSSITAFKDRQESYISTCDSMICEAEKGILTATRVEEFLAQFHNDVQNKADFRLIEAVRLLYMTTDYNDKIFAAVANRAPFWVQEGDVVQNYWTENHQIMWTSSAYLLKQAFGDKLQYDSNLEQRLETYLELKSKYGYYEINSAVYFPFTMGALLNLADFAQETEIQILAIEALEKMLDGVIKNTNSIGAFYPAMGRGSLGRFMDDPFYSGDNKGNIKCIYLLTGIAPNGDKNAISTSAHETVAMLAVTDAANLENVLIKDFQKEIVEDVQISGNTPAEFETLTLFTELPDFEKTIFQLSAVAFWSPPFADDTIAFVNQFSLWKNPEFKPYAFFQDPKLVTQFSPISGGSIITDIEIVLHKNGVSMLSSMQNYNFKQFGSQQVPFAATTGTFTVFGFSGPGEGGVVNTHLPLVKQHENVAVIKYDSSLLKPFTPYLGQLLGLTDAERVSIYFPRSKFTEVREYNNWILAKETNGFTDEEGYVALRRVANCLSPDSEDNDFIRCTETLQEYCLIVGNDVKYITFDEFEKAIQTANVEADSCQIGGLPSSEKNILENFYPDDGVFDFGLNDYEYYDYTKYILYLLVICNVIMSVYLCFKRESAKTKYFSVGQESDIETEQESLKQ